MEYLPLQRKDGLTRNIAEHSPICFFLPTKIPQKVIPYRPRQLLGSQTDISLLLNLLQQNPSVLRKKILNEAKEK